MTKWFEFLKDKPSDFDYDNVVCKNCETHFNGKFCPECGQAIKDYDKPFGFIFYNFLGDFFSFDTRFIRSFGSLLVKPGFLTFEYFNGRRVKYAPPFRIFIFVSFVMFLLLQIYTNRGLTKVLDAELSDKNLFSIDSVSAMAVDSILSQVKVEMDSTQAENLNFHIDMETFRDTRDLRNGLNKFAVSLEKKLETETNSKKREKLQEYIRLCRSPEQAVARILEYMSWAFFLLLPVFALILKLAYIRRKQYYMRHLIFSIHIHSFVFVILSLIVGLYLITNVNLKFVSTILFLSVPVYFILALKKFYGQSYGKVVLKFFAVSFLYNVIFFFTVGFVFLNALSII